MPVEPFWTQVNEPTLHQGDYLPTCLVPILGPSFAGSGGTREMTAGETDLIVLTQSCDLEQRKVRLVATCPIYPVAVFETVNPAFAKKGR